MEKKSFLDSLHDLVLFCSEHDALKWREIWNNWTYSEAVEFSFLLAKENRRKAEELNGIEDPMVQLITLLMQRIR